MKPTICLSMIVKNEAHCIEKCLESVKPIITNWLIADNGSTDNTRQVVQNCLKGIPGEYALTTWKDFSTNRNEALSLATKFNCDYILVIDADDYLVINDLSEFEHINKPVYSFNIKHGSITYPRPQLVKTSINA